MRFVHTADSHLGFEISRTPQGDPSGRRRRSESVTSNLLAVLEHAVECEADFLIHSGDLFNKYYLPRAEMETLVAPFSDLVKAGCRVLVIPGNHERSQFPYDLFHGLKGLFVFDEPKTVCIEAGGYAVGIAGFPFIRHDSRRQFAAAVKATDYRGVSCDFPILATHQAFDMAVVGPGEFFFRAGQSDTVSRETVPVDFEYIAAGHIHRAQSLPHPRRPGLYFAYPGSTQRMSFAEMREEKGFIEAELLGDRIETRFVPLPAYDMEIVEIAAAGLTAAECAEAIRRQFWRLHENLVIRFNLTGGAAPADYPALDFQALRAALPPVLECQFAIQTRTKWIAR